MGDTDNGAYNGGNVKRARILVLLVPIALFIIVGVVALVSSNTNLFSSFEPRANTGIAQDGTTTEAAVARDIEREAQVLDVLALVIEDGTAYFWIVDLQSGTQWSDRDSKAVTRAFDVMLDWAKINEYGVSITFFAIQSLMGTEGLPVDVFEGVFRIVCPSDLVAEYNIGGANSDAIMSLCQTSPDGGYIDGTGLVPLIGR